MWLLSIILPGLLLTSNACGPADNEPVEAENPTPAPDPTPDPQPAGNRALVVYFSCTNTTKGIADRIVEATGAAVWRIIPEVAYTSEDLNYNESSSRDPRAERSVGTSCHPRQVRCSGQLRCGFPRLSHLVGNGSESHLYLPRKPRPYGQDRHSVLHFALQRYRVERYRPAPSGNRFRVETGSRTYTFTEYHKTANN